MQRVSASTTPMTAAREAADVSHTVSTSGVKAQQQSRHSSSFSSKPSVLDLGFGSMAGPLTTNFSVGTVTGAYVICVLVCVLVYVCLYVCVCLCMCVCMCVCV